MFSVNPRNVAELVLKNYEDLPPTEVSIKDIELQQHIIDVIESVLHSRDNELITFSSLDVDMNPDEEGVVPDEDCDESFSFEDPGPSTSRPRDDAIDLAYKKKAVDFWRTPRANGQKQLLATVQKRFKRLKSPQLLYRWAEQVDAGGTHDDKCAEIARLTLNEFNAALEEGGAVHDVDIKRWAIDAASQINCPNLKACHSWVQLFKKRHRIRSRKITKFVARGNFKERIVELRKSADTFVREVRPLIEELGEENVYNTDQSGFNLEMCSGRTLHKKGVKTVEVAVQSKNSTTHSYTIQPLISCDGRLVGPLLIVVKEKNGQFGRRVKNTLFRAENVLVLPSTSGKCTTEIMKKWYKDVFLKHAGERSALLVDAWGGFKKMKESVTTSKSVTLKFIPEGTTGIAQPCDVYGARLWKNYVRRLSELLKRVDPTIILYQRNNIIKLQSLVYIQFNSPRFSDLFKYSWYSSGYVSTRKGENFKTPANFGFDDLGDGGCAACEDVPIVRCSWCTDVLCAQHFFVNYHDCKLFVK